MFGFFQAVFVIVVVIIRKELKSRLLFKMGLKRRITFVLTMMKNQRLSVVFA